MKVVYHERYCDVYTHDPAAEAGRIESIRDALKGRFDVVEPRPASEDDVSLIHTSNHIRFVRSNKAIYEVALLAVGGAIKAAELAVGGEPAFGLIRPPGHHASRDSSWGFCYFNNIAISVQRLLQHGSIKNVIIVDFDLHFGDGTDNIFRGVPAVSYLHLPLSNSLEALDEYLRSQKDYDIISVSAGFDRHQDDWGGMLSTQDYKMMGEILKEHAEKKCGGRVFAVLEGGYNHRVLGKNVRAFLEGME
ncbi:MAG: histone deacetylase family protein [archaeon]|nr:histone deacetylase family protein [archaeon]MCP8305792.1 histone deacetylase family protein [archaeon]